MVLKVCQLIRCHWPQNLTQVTEQFGAWLFSTMKLNRENEWLLQQQKHRCLHDFLFFAPQETDHWKITEMEVENYIVFGCEHCRKAILCPRHVSQFRRSWLCHARCTAIRVGSVMILSIYMQNSGCDEENYIAGLEIVKMIMEERKEMGAKDFFIGIELKLMGGSEDVEGLDNIDGYGLYGPEYCGGGEDVVTYEKSYAGCNHQMILLAR